VPIIPRTFARGLRAPLLALAALPLFSAAAQAQSAALVLELAAEFGGDPIVEVLFLDGTSQDVNAGQGVTGAVGGIVRPSASSPLGLRGTVGFKYVTTAADNAHIRLTRVPIELLATYDLPRDFWIGGGVVHHTAIEFKGDGLGPDASFDDATGATAEVGWKWVALTFTGMQYTGPSGEEFDASSVGVSFTYTIGG
jgi:hypothetical protein